ncbi:MAG: SCO family protein [Sandaracinaceae bacterium]|nr:SCO family protein [Sandaracinaceae bacterium]
MKEPSMIKMNPTILLLFLVGCGGQESEHAGHDDHEAHPAAQVASGEGEPSEHAEHEAHEHTALAATEGMDRQATLHDLDAVFTDASGASVRLRDLSGAPALVTMFYGSCTTICPLILTDLARIAEEVGDPSLRVVAATFDPERDTAERLGAITRERGLDPARFRLVRGDEEGTRDLAMALGIQYRRLPNGEFAHSALITLIDAEGHVVTRHEGVGQPLHTIIAQARALTPAPAPAAGANTVTP